MRPTICRASNQRWGRFLGKLCPAERSHARALLRWRNSRGRLTSCALNPVAGPLIPSLARVVRGLSAVFWGLPLAVLAAAKTALGEGPRIFPILWGSGMGPWGRVLGDTLTACLMAMVASGLVWYGLRQMVRFQPQEQIWIAAVNRASLAAMMVLGLLPFAHWWSRYPAHPLFDRGVALLFAAGILLGLALNHLLIRLAAMLPDEILRQDARLLARVDQALLVALLAFAAVDWWMPSWIVRVPDAWGPVVLAVHELRSPLLLLGALIPLALTMTLLWKAKETIIAGVFRDG